MFRVGTGFASPSVDWGAAEAQMQSATSVHAGCR